jgi:prevent-host-death family protein
MRVLNIQEAKTHLSRLVDEAVAGEDIVIAKAGRPQVKLTPCLREQTPRVPGEWQGRLWMANDFDATSDELVRLFEGEEDAVKAPAPRRKRPTAQGTQRRKAR